MNGQDRARFAQIFYRERRESTNEYVFSPDLQHYADWKF